MKERIVFFTCIVLTCLFSPLSSQEVDTRSCVSTYTNQTVSSSVSVLGCNTLAVQNVTVASNGNLSLSAPAQITINGPFEVKSGGILNIRQSQQMIFTYTYDAKTTVLTVTYKEDGDLVPTDIDTYYVTFRGNTMTTRQFFDDEIGDDSYVTTWTKQ